MAAPDPIASATRRVEILEEQLDLRKKNKDDAALIEHTQTQLDAARETLAALQKKPKTSPAPAQ